MKYKLLIIPTVALAILLTSCGVKTANDTSASVSETVTANAEEKQASLLSETPDGGQEYIDSFIFFGESTTYHLKSRGVLSGGRNTTQVWSPKNGTVNLDTTVKTLKIVYPETAEEITVGEAVRRKKPKYMLLTFGLNGAVQKVGAGEEYFRACYMSLIKEIRTNSPDTVIILQSCFPIAETMDMSSYSVDAKKLMEYIRLINSWTLKLADDEKLAYLNTAEVLTNERGFLYPSYDNGDGHHLTTEAYLKILEYIRTHKYMENV